MLLGRSSREKRGEAVNVEVSIGKAEDLRHHAEHHQQAGADDEDHRGAQRDIEGKVAYGLRLVFGGLHPEDVEHAEVIKSGNGAGEKAGYGQPRQSGMDGRSEDGIFADKPAQAREAGQTEHEKCHHDAEKRFPIADPRERIECLLLPFLAIPFQKG